MKYHKFCLFALRDSLFTFSQSVSLSNSKFKFSSNVRPFLSSKVGLLMFPINVVSSAYIIVCSRLLHFAMSFISIL